MSLLSSFISENILNELEAAFIRNEPALQMALLNEVQTFSAKLVFWIEGKLSAGQAPIISEGQ